jgi:GxxExxY protein
MVAPRPVRVKTYPQMTQIAQIKSDHRDPQTYTLIGAAMAVHRTLGAGFLEAVYREALAIELETKSVPFQREAPLKIRYRNAVLATSYRADFVCFESVIVEVKALARLSPADEAQIINYLKASKTERGGISSLSFFPNQSAFICVICG